MIDRVHQVHKQTSKIREIDLFLSKRLGGIRETKSISPDLMASELTISIDLLGEYEAGTKKISAALLCRMSQILCVELSYIFSDKPSSSTRALEKN